MNFRIISIVYLSLNPHFWISILSFISLFKLNLRWMFWIIKSILILRKLTLKRFLLSYFETINLLIKSLTMNAWMVVICEKFIVFLFHSMFYICSSWSVLIPLVIVLRVTNRCWWTLLFLILLSQGSIRSGRKVKLIIVLFSMNLLRWLEGWIILFREIQSLYFLLRIVKASKWN